MITDEQKTGFNNLIELFDEIRRYVIQINRELPQEPREDLLSQLYRFKDDLIFFDSSNVLIQILESIIAGVEPLTAREEQDREVFLNRSFREYRGPTRS